MKKILKIAAFTVVGSVLGLSANAATLLTNGDFEAGNTGFSTDLLFVPSSGNGPSRYDIDTNPNAWFGSFSSFGDNTTGTGNMMMINGSTTAGDTVWEQTVSVVANTIYSFDGFIAAIFRGSSSVQLAINGSVVETVTGPSATGVWEAFGTDWMSGSATSATVTILQNSTAFGGNDYALDDLSFTAAGTSVAPVPLPAGLPLLASSLLAIGWIRRKARS
ncbi:MAG: hypothetical protein AAF665_14050 [Pseudomonadota bacterium]